MAQGLSLSPFSLNRRHFLTLACLTPAVPCLDACSFTDLKLASTDISRPAMNTQPRNKLKTGGDLSLFLDQTMPPNWNYYHIDGNYQSVATLAYATQPCPLIINSAGIPIPNRE